MKITIYPKTGQPLEVDVADNFTVDRARDGSGTRLPDVLSIGATSTGKQIWVSLSELVALVPGDHRRVNRHDS